MTRVEYNKILWSKYHRLNINNIVERFCIQCEEWKEENTDNFYMMNKSYPERGYQSKCKECIIKNNDKNRTEKYDDYYRDYNKELYLRNPDKFIETDRQHRLLNPEVHKLKDKKWREANPEKCREYSRQHRNHDISENEWRACLKIFKNKCAYCGLPFEQHIVQRKGKYITMKLHKDHVDDEGYNDLRNAVPSCQSCNSSKHEDSLDDWYKLRDFFTEDRYNKIIWWIEEGYKDYIEKKPPYRIIRKQNKDKKSFHWEMWSVDEMRNMIECLVVGAKKKDLITK